jgi:hypothetical protein
MSVLHRSRGATSPEVYKSLGQAPRAVRVALPPIRPQQGKGKVVRFVCNDDEISSDDDVPLQKQMRLCGQGRSMAGGPPLATHVPRPASSAVARATMPGGSSGRGCGCSHRKGGRRRGDEKEGHRGGGSVEEGRRGGGGEEGHRRGRPPMRRRQKRRPQRRRRRRLEVVWRLWALAHLRLHRQESRGWLHPMALHLRPSGDSTTPGSLGTLCDPSFVISCTTSVILI